MWRDINKNIMGKIIGRENERCILEELYKSGQAEFAAVYGRRRVGKTFLIREHFKDRFAFCHTGLSPFELKGSQMMRSQLQNFSYSLARFGAEIDNVPKDWMEAFNILIRLLESKGKDRRLVVFIDEIPWIATPRSGFITALEHFWNGWGAGQNNLLLIVCGSATSWINDNLINNTGGLYGRLTRQMHLSPMTLYETEQLFGSNGIVMDRYDIVQSYMVFGGIPYYLNAFTKGKSLSWNIDRLMFGKDAGFTDEFDRMFRSLFVNADEYQKIVRFLAKSRNGYTREEIASSTTSSGGGLTKILKGLQESGFISVCKDTGGKAKNSRYRLSDPFCLFWLQFKDNIRTTDESFWENSQFLPGINSWRGFAFENVCFMHIPQIKAALGISGVHTEVSSWTYKGDSIHDGAQIDMLIERADRIINLCEIKFSISEYAITKDYDRRLRTRLQTFLDVMRPKSSIHHTLVTTYGLKENEYSGRFQNVITLDGLFR